MTNRVGYSVTVSSSRRTGTNHSIGRSYISRLRARVGRVKYVVGQTRTGARFRIVELTHVAHPEVDAGHTGMSQRKRERHLRKRHTRLARNAGELLAHAALALIAGSRQVEPRPQDRVMLAPLPLYEACPRIAWNRGIAAIFPGKPSSIQRTPCQESHAEM